MMLLLAREGILEALGRALSEGPRASELALFAGGVVVLVVLIALAARFFNTEKPVETEPGTDYLTLFVDLLGLTEQDRRDLREIARRTELDQPAAMLLSPMNLAIAVHGAASGEGGQELLKRTQRLCQRVFDAPLPAPPNRSSARSGALGANRV